MRPEARTALLDALDRLPGNPSGQHRWAREARRALDDARDQVADVVGCRPGEVVFTSGGTEADNLAVTGIYRARRAEDPRRTRVLASAVEHHAVLDPVDHLADHEGADVRWLAVDDLGRVRLDWFERELLAAPDEVALVTMMWANNEVGTVQPVAEVAALCAEHGVPFHTDAVQALCAVEVDGGVADTLALSAHKVGGPHGVGALVVRKGVALQPLLHGGGQERDIRSGTLDSASIAGFAAAVAASSADRDERVPRVRGLRDQLVKRIVDEIDGVVRNGDPDHCLPGIAHLSFEGCEGDALLLLLDAAGVECSRGSACSAGVPQPSHVLLAMGRDAVEAKASLRFSLGWSSTQDDVDRVLEVLPGAVARARRAGQSR